MAPSLKAHIDTAMGRQQADLVVKNVNILDVRTGSIRKGDIAVCGETIVGIYDSYSGKTEIDGSGLYATPGFIDTHYHNESSLVVPAEFERMVLPMGTTTSIWDPHEIANVVGTEAFKFAQKSSAAAIMDIVVHLSSCVPATSIGTSGAVINAEDMKGFLATPPRVAEVMDLGSVLGGEADMMQKLEQGRDGFVDGHMPGVGLHPGDSQVLNALASANIRTDHESTTYDEAIMKRDRGISILIREGTACKNLEALMPYITTANSWISAFCTDDFHPADIVREGHLNYIIRKAISLYDPELNGPDKQAHIVNVYRIATYAAAQIGGLNVGLKRRGELTPGAQADIVLIGDLEKCDVKNVIKKGRVVNEELFATRPAVAPVGLNSVKIGEIKPEQFRLAPRDGANVSVVKVQGTNILTEAVDTTLPIQNGYLERDTGRDILKAAVIERHGRTNGNIGIGFVQGFELGRGAIAATVGHDDHNITVVGVTDEEMALAVNELKAMGGGYVVVDGKDVLARLPLPVAGLMSDKSFEQVAQEEEAIRAAATSLAAPGKKGLPQPLIIMAFMSLSVIPDIRITDAGITRNAGTGPTLVWDQRKNAPQP